MAGLFQVLGGVPRLETEKESVGDDDDDDGIGAKESKKEQNHVEGESG